jgi:hypothetical protein
MFDAEVSPKENKGEKCSDEANRVEHLGAAAYSVMAFSFDSFEIREIETKIGCRLFGGWLLRVSQGAAIVLGGVHN